MAEGAVLAAGKQLLGHENSTLKLRAWDRRLSKIHEGKPQAAPSYWALGFPALPHSRVVHKQREKQLTKKIISWGGPWVACSPPTATSYAKTITNGLTLNVLGHYTCALLFSGVSLEDYHTLEKEMKVADRCALPATAILAFFQRKGYELKDVETDTNLGETMKWVRLVKANHTN
eukprot:TRINITY_DN61636_c0_g1_i1.p1 TRINITY_DN61636_c0_g1~~TRINITY_DN61636_c0_g1_i1.p1  ORF type:complete len:175 (+),score=1.84 TRINITY_DN61636_c0_g1_i1:50-574(+)